ncbi:MAG: ATP-binding protein [Bacteroidales bacterium]|nr:ATP-binding protein [Bacteroidales bacterium]
MIQELKITNFLSFKDEVTFSFEATKDTMFDECYVVEVDKGVRLLRFALVYGANASGKTNLLNAFDFLRHFWFYKPSDLDEETEAVPFKLDRETPNQPSKLELKFYVDNTKYWYILELDEKRVYKEKLLYYKSAQPTMLFERKLKTNLTVVSFNNAIIKMSKAALDEITLKCLSNMSLFAAKNQVNVAIPEMDVVSEWMKKRILPAIDPQTPMQDYAEHIIKDDPVFKSYLLDFINRADFNITNIASDVKKKPISRANFARILNLVNISDDEKDRLQHDMSIESIETVFEHTVRNSRGKEKYIMPDFLQSDGTIRTIGIEAGIYSAIQNEAFLHIDEIESSLHPDLVEFIIRKFLLSKGRSQLLVSTHYDPLLNTVDDLIRRDSIWFVEKDERGVSNLYSLVEFKGQKRITSLQRAYRNGMFGALPVIKD